MVYRNILVPLDGSPFAEHALPLARSIARRCGANLHLAHVIAPITEAYVEGMFFAGELIEDVRQRQREYLADVVKRLGMTEMVSSTVLEGEVASTLSDHAAVIGADLVVMATHARGPLGRFWLGSVADEVEHEVEVPLLLVRPEEKWVDLNQEPAPGRVVLPLDGSPLAEGILEPAIAIGALMPNMEFILVRAIRPVVPVYAMPEPPVIDAEGSRLMDQVETMQEQLKQEAQAYLDTVAARLKNRGLNVRTHVVLEDRPAQAILHEAEATGAGLIALETHGRRGLARLVMGSVADQVVRRAHVPVLVQRPTHV
jgi:nucleotide-binding universal stress UspA family protein